MIVLRAFEHFSRNFSSLSLVEIKTAVVQREGWNLQMDLVCCSARLLAEGNPADEISPLRLVRMRELIM